MRPLVIRSLVALAAIATVTFAGTSTPLVQEPADDPAQDDRQAQIEALTAEVVALRLEVERLSAVTADVVERTATLESGFSTLTKEAKALTKVLDRSEEQGFTAGINFESRVTLLAGWRRYLNALSAAAPKAQQPEEGRERN